MAHLHEALKGLCPVSFDTVPQDEGPLKEYLEDAFTKGQLLIDSVPPPPADSPAVTKTRPRSDTASSIASNLSEMSSSSARADPLVPSHSLLQKEWGKPIKLSAKDNPMGMGVYKLSGKDGRAWFARRSVHEGMPFSYWKKALQREFPESLEVQGAPGEGNIRGIGAEKKVFKKVVKGVGSVEVYHLSAQFPGPTTPRDFVTLLLTSSAALKKPIDDDTRSDSKLESELADFSDIPRHFMVISKPCDHPDCPPRPGFIRGSYESVEFIREVPLKPRKSASTTDLTRLNAKRSGAHSLNKAAMLRNARQRAETLGTDDTGDSTASDSKSAEHPDSRTRGKTISFAESRGSSAKGETMDFASEGSDGEDEEINPVEWIMITRSDPGGSVPRFMVERGTPSSIVADAGKFLDWACKKGHLGVDENGRPESSDAILETQGGKELEEIKENGTIPNHGGSPEAQTSSPPSVRPLEEPTISDASTPPRSLFSTAVNAAYSGLETYAPQTILDRLPVHQEAPSTPSPLASSRSHVTEFSPGTVDSADSDGDDASSTTSFASADSHLSTPSVQSTTLGSSPSASKTENMTSIDKVVAKLSTHKARLNEKLQQVREKETRDKGEGDLTSKEEARIKKAEEKHAKEVRKAEERFEKEIKQLEVRRKKDEEKERKRKISDAEKERKRKEQEAEKERKNKEKEDKDREKKERDALTAEIKELKKDRNQLEKRIGQLEKEAEVEKEARRKEAEAKETQKKERERLEGESKQLNRERNLIEARAGELQKQNTALVAALGLLDGGDKILRGLDLGGNAEEANGSAANLTDRLKESLNA